MKIRPSLVTASILACYAFSANANGGNTVTNPFLRSAQRAVAPQSASPVVEPALDAEAWAPEPLKPVSPISAKDLVEPIPEKGPSYRPKRLIKASAARLANSATPPASKLSPSEAVEKQIPAPPEAVSEPALAPPLPSPPRQINLPPPVPRTAAAVAVIPPPPSTAVIESPVKASSDPAPAPKVVLSTDDKIAAERAARKARCADVEYKGKQLTVIPPSSTTFSLPFKGLRGCLTAIGAQESWVEVVDSRSDTIELFADENTTSANRRASINVVTPSGTIEVRVLQRKYDYQEKKPAKPGVGAAPK